MPDATYILDMRNDSLIWCLRNYEPIVLAEDAMRTCRGIVCVFERDHPGRTARLHHVVTANQEDRQHLGRALGFKSVAPSRPDPRRPPAAHKAGFLDGSRGFFPRRP